MSSNNSDTPATPETRPERAPAKPLPLKRGRKPKYSNDFERKEAKRIQNKAYRERKKLELIELRRTAAVAKLLTDSVDNISPEPEP